MDNLILYHDLMTDPLIMGLSGLIDTEEEKAIGDQLFKVIRILVTRSETFEHYFFTKMIATRNPILDALACGNRNSESLHFLTLQIDLEVIGSFLSRVYSIIAAYDGKGKEILKRLFNVNDHFEMINAYSEYFRKLEKCEGIDEAVIHDFAGLLEKYGNGIYASHEAFYLDDENQLVPIEKYCSLPWDRIYHYDRQKKALKKNVMDFIEGRPFNHGLLVGASGTGKSSSVKGVVELLAHKKLRLIQLYKGQLKNLPKLLDELSQVNFKFVLFLDDLSFEVNEDEYKLLKTYIEGGVVDVAGNIMFCVTTNRRHLIKEVRSEREGDIHLQDFIQEMTSLSKRFGLTLTFEPLVQDEYFDMIRSMMGKEGLVYDPETIEVEARRFSLRKAGMSGRVANQFVKMKLTEKAWS